MSVPTFKRKLENLYGQAPKKWLTGQRLQLAAELLRSGVEIPRYTTGLATKIIRAFLLHFENALVLGQVNIRQNN